MKLKSTLISLICVAVVGVVGGVLTMYWPAITGTVTNNQYLTPEQGQAMYDKGYADGNKNEENQLSQIDYYKNLTDEYALQFNIMDGEITNLNSTVASNNQSIQNLTTQRNELQQRVTSLQNIKTQNEETISGLNAQIFALEATVSDLQTQKTNLESQVSTLQNNKTQNEYLIRELNLQVAALQAQADQVPGLNSQVTNLQNLVSQLQLTNQVNSDTINSLNVQMSTLNNQIRELSTSIQNANSQVSILTNRNNELQSTISYYENYIATIENTVQSVASYEVAGVLTKIEIVDKGAEITLPIIPNKMDYYFNGWKVNGEGDLLGETYILNSNTKFVADLTYRYQVRFMGIPGSNGTYVTDGDCVIVLPNSSQTNKTGYRFLGWSLDGVNVIENETILQTPVTANITYHAVYVKTYTLTYYDTVPGTSVIYRTEVDSGTYIPTRTISNKSGYKILGWSLDGENVIENIDQVLVTADTNVYALYAKEHVVRWVNSINNQQYRSERVYHNECPTYKYFPNMTDCKFLGWSLDGVNVVENINEVPITEDTTIYALFAIKHTVSFKYKRYNTQQGLTDITMIHKVFTYEYDDPSTFSANISCADFVGWKLGDELVDVASYQIVADTEFVAEYNYYDWWETSWNYSSLSADYIWSDGDDIYCSNGSKQLKLNEETQRWESMTWDGFSGNGQYIFRDNKTGDIYYSKLGGVYGNSYRIELLKLNKETKAWSTVYFTTSKTNLSSMVHGCLWSDDDNIYYSQGNKQLKLNRDTLELEPIEWVGLTNFLGYNVKYDNGNYYCGTYRLIKGTYEWESVTFSVNINTWTDGENYYINNTKVYNELTNEWEDKTWTGLDNVSPFQGKYVWHSKNYTYYSYYDYQYVLHKAV